MCSPETCAAAGLTSRARTTRPARQIPRPNRPRQRIPGMLVADRGAEKARCVDHWSMEGQSLRGKLLIAGPGLFDPNFRRTVLLVGEHNDEGALAVVLNRPTPATVREAIPPLADVV